jgi:programmed cell death protein 5
MMLVQALTNEARERLARIQMVKPEKVRQLEEICLMHWMKNMRSGAGGGFKITEDDLLELLDSMERQQYQQQQQKVIVARRQDFEDEDIDLDQFDV